MILGGVTALVGVVFDPEEMAVRYEAGDMPLNGRDERAARRQATPSP